MRAISTLPLTWLALQAHCRRPWLLNHRGELPTPPGSAALNAPLPIAAMAQFGQRHYFGSEAEAECFRRIGRHAQNAVMAWSAAKYSREDVRIMVGCVRYWRERGNDGQAALSRSELRCRWLVYRKHMAKVGDQVDRVRVALTPRVAPVVTLMATAAE